MSARGQLLALARRDLRVQLSYTFGFGVRLFAILLSVAMFYFVARLVGDAPELGRYQGEYFAYVLLGLVVVVFSSACVRAFNESIREAHSDGTLEILLTTPASLPTLMGGMLAVPLLMALVEATAIFTAGWLAGGVTIHVAGLLLAVPLLVLTLTTFAGVGIVAAAVIVLTKRGDPFSALMLQASHLLAGVYFPVALLPDALQALARLFPAYWGLRGLREVLLAGGGLADVRVDLAVLAGFNVAVLPAAMWVLARALRYARQAGTLGNR